VGPISRKRALAHSASVDNLGEAFFHLVKFCFGQIFQPREFVAGACAEPLAPPFVRHEQAVQAATGEGLGAVSRAFEAHN
jgi:hypothetical protein